MHLSIVLSIFCIIQIQWQWIQATVASQYPRVYMEPGVKKLTVHWNATDKIFRRTINVYQDNWTTTMHAELGVSKFDIENLVPCKIYKISVRTFTEMDKDGREVWLCGTPLPDTSEPVQHPDVHSLSGGKMQAIRWSRPKASKNCMVQYQVDIKAVNEPQRSLVVYYHGTHIIYNLQENTTYYYTIQPIWNGIHGSISEVISEKTEVYDYSAILPYNLTVVGGPRLLRISWNIEKVSEADIKYFIIDINDKAIVIDKSERHRTVTDLDECRLMGVKIVAVATNDRHSPPVVMYGKPMTEDGKYCSVQDE